MAKNRVYVDNQVDMAYVSMSARTVSRTIELSENVTMDIAADGTICGLEILDPSADAMSALRKVALR